MPQRDLAVAVGFDALQGSLGDAGQPGQAGLTEVPRNANFTQATWT
jgi:hypothetical protein